jgi:hypothetical protein
LSSFCMQYLPYVARLFAAKKADEEFENIEKELKESDKSKSGGCSGQHS